MGFKKGEGGRPKGALNKATREIKDFCREQLEHPDYVAKAVSRVRAGKAPHLEILWYNHAYGKPRDVIAIENAVPLVIDELKRS